MFFGGSSPVLLSISLTRSLAFIYLLYTDPGSGTLIWQLLLAAFFGVMFYFRRFRDFLSRRRK